MSHLAEEFFEQDPIACARALVGCELRWNGMSAVVVETEAYLAVGDEACHTFNRPSAREFVSRNRAGTAYVYLNYGVHWMLNALVKGRTEGFVLIRALEPVRGTEQMLARSGKREAKALCSGPGKLTRALGITGADHGRSLCEGGCGFLAGAPAGAVVADRRVGISRAAEVPWRFLLQGNPHVSVPFGRVRLPKPAQSGGLSDRS